MKCCCYNWIKYKTTIFFIIMKKEKKLFYKHVLQGGYLKLLETYLANLRNLCKGSFINYGTQEGGGGREGPSGCNDASLGDGGGTACVTVDFRVM